MSKKRGEKSLARISTVHFQPFCRRLSSKGIFYLPIDMKDCTCQTIEENFFGKKILQPWLKEVLYNYFFSRDPILIYTIYVHWLTLQQYSIRSLTLGQSFCGSIVFNSTRSLQGQIRQLVKFSVTENLNVCNHTQGFAIDTFSFLFFKKDNTVHVQFLDFYKM